MWYWEFNAGTYYTTCFEVEITGETDTESDDDNIYSSSKPFDDYLVYIPLFYVGAIYDEVTLVSGANNIKLDDDNITLDFMVGNVQVTHTKYVCVAFNLFSLFIINFPVHDFVLL